jgi:flagellar basal-body rod protein FlgG
MSLVESAASILSGSDRQLEIAAQNISNMTSPGYRARQSFWSLLGDADPAGTAVPDVQSVADFSIGKISDTSNPYDLALGANGFFVVSKGTETHYTRNGQFSRDADGRLVTADGFALQGDGGDLILRGDAIKFLADGTVLDAGEPAGRIAVQDFPEKSGLVAVGDGGFSAPAGGVVDVAQPDLHQGAIETSNVSIARETLAMMSALRTAETGQRLVQLYDGLMDQAIASFGRDLQ